MNKIVETAGFDQVGNGHLLSIWIKIFQKTNKILGSINRCFDIFIHGGHKNYLQALYGREYLENFCRKDLFSSDT